MQRRLFCVLHPSTVLSVALLAMSIHAHASELDQQLRDHYQGKTFLLRGFYSGERLRYDSQGAPAGDVNSGDWTADGFVQVQAIHFSGQTLKIKGRRVLVVSPRKGLQFRVEEDIHKKKDQKAVLVEIEAALGTNNPSAEQADAVLSKIFLTPNDNVVSLLPDFWKPCILDGLSGKNENCRFSSEIAAVPGVPSSSSASGASTSPSSGVTGSDSLRDSPVGVFRVEKGVKPPRLLSQSEPSFSEPARKAKYQGVTTLGLIVNEQGVPTNIHVISPLGGGLDAEAVRAVETWKFKPAEKDGQPVRAEIAVEVDFHLY